MIYGDGQKIWIKINGVLVVVNAATPDEEDLRWERVTGLKRQWFYYINRDDFKYQVNPKQVIGPYDPLKPVKHLKNRIIKL